MGHRVWFMRKKRYRVGKEICSKSELLLRTHMMKPSERQNADILFNKKQCCFFCYIVIYTLICFNLKKYSKSVRRLQKKNALCDHVLVLKRC